MEVKLYQRVALCRDLPEHRLKRGDVATLVDRVPHPEGKEEGCVLEVFSALGDSIMVIVVPRSAIQPLQANQVLSVRPFETPS
jgi:hypothetical protein